MTSKHALASIWHDTDAMTRNRAVGYAFSSPPALKMIRTSGLIEAEGPPNVFDNGCGDGLVAQLVWDNLSQNARNGLELLCADRSPAMVKFAEERIEKGKWPKAKAIVADMQDMTGIDDSSFTHCFSNFAIQFPEKSDAVFGELKRVCQSNAVVAATTWKAVGWTAYVRAALARLPGCPAFPDDETMFMKVTNGNAWHTEQFIEAKLSSSGFANIQIEESADEHTLPSHVFASAMGGMMAKSMVPLFWSPDAVHEFGGQIEDALLSYFKEEKLEEVTFQNVALVFVARTPDK